MGVVRDPFCRACGHSRAKHGPDGCSGRSCDCEDIAPVTLVRRDGTTHQSMGDARGYRWEPFKEGNVAAVRHGTTSPRLVSLRAALVLEELCQKWPWLLEADGPTVDSLCRAKAVIDPLHEYVTGVIAGTVEAHPRLGVPTTGVEAVPDRVWQALDRSERQFMAASAKLGFNPVDRAALVKDTGIGKHFAGEALDGVARRGRQIRDASR